MERRRWWEFNENVVKYLNEKHQIGRRIPEFYSLPNDTICWWFKKGKERTEERLHRVLAIGLHEPKGMFEYDMLEMEQLFLRRMSDKMLALTQEEYKKSGGVYRIRIVYVNASESSSEGPLK